MNWRKSVQILGLLTALGLTLQPNHHHPQQQPVQERQIPLEERLLQSIVVIGEVSTRTFRTNLKEYFLFPNNQANSSCILLPKELELHYSEFNINYNGTGTVIDAKQGMVITAAHCIHFNGTHPVIGFIGREEQLRAEVLAYRVDLDLAVLQVSDLTSYGLVGLNIAENNPAVNELVYTQGMAGAEREGDTTISIHPPHPGTVTAVQTTEYGREIIYVEAPINRGDSGGPIVNNNRELVGITTNVGGSGTGLNNIREILKEINYQSN
jgi:S1-C subfamily serine protease